MVLPPELNTKKVALPIVLHERVDVAGVPSSFLSAENGFDRRANRVALARWRFIGSGQRAGTGVVAPGEMVNSRAEGEQQKRQAQANYDYDWTRLAPAFI